MNFFRFMLFFPSVSFSMGVSEIFPWALLYSSIVFIGVTRVNKYLLICILMTIVSCVYGAVRYWPNIDFLRSFFAYFNALICFYALIRVSPSELLAVSKLVPVVLCLLLLVGLVQSSGVISNQFLQSVFGILIPRSELTMLGAGRGVTLLSTEPARAGLEVIFVFALWRMLSGRRSTIWLDLLLLLFVVLAIKSVIALAFFFVYFFTVRPYVALASFCGFVMLALLAGLNSDVRSLDVFTTLVKQATFVDAFKFIVQASGFRLVSIISAYHEGFTTIVGHGVGAWESSSVIAMRNSGFEPRDIPYFQERIHSLRTFAVRPTSFFANVALDMGLLGVLVFGYAVWRGCGRFRSIASHQVAPLALFLTSVVLVGSVGNPVPWLALALTVRCNELIGDHKT